MSACSGPLPLGVEERELAHPGVGALASVLDGHLDLNRRIRREVRSLEVREREILLEQRRPASARGVAHLLAAAIDRDAAAPGDGRERGCQAHRPEERLEGIPVDFDPYEAPRGSARLLGPPATMDPVIRARPRRPPPVRSRLPCRTRSAAAGGDWARPP